MADAAHLWLSIFNAFMTMVHSLPALPPMNG